MKEIIAGFAMFWGMGIGVGVVGWIFVSLQMKFFPGGPGAHPDILLGMLAGFATLLIAAVGFVFVATRSIQ